MEVTRYHKFLRTSLVVTALIFVFDGGFLFPVTKQLSESTTTYIATVGSSLSASVPPNELNTLSAQLAEQKRLLDAREKELAEREIPNRFANLGSADTSTFVLSIVLFLQTVLIVTNYVMDFIRAKRLRYG